MWTLCTTMQNKISLVMHILMMDVHTSLILFLTDASHAECVTGASVHTPIQRNSTNVKTIIQSIYKTIRLEHYHSPIRPYEQRHQGPPLPGPDRWNPACFTDMLRLRLRLRARAYPTPSQSMQERHRCIKSPPSVTSYIRH